ncbi:SusC/RagA family TonB-linked outer membrane protein [Chitinophaga ginsengisoli]|uniref:TonB-linked SusC/RagA family outer membrane protein n=1 Tax=Chitinophaga ginsengisoli TaxID=363837 RepID=A0A2P8GHC8_9BACT|nr:SusC/RagA family TonB-linked outer membrane protein [Chitinophaga ginsengisoli]PSL33379.1 TonB-linked SusC/RagA family outer membrane protein [Chitinophaga ginsengisoli]
MKRGFSFLSRVCLHSLWMLLLSLVAVSQSRTITGKVTETPGNTPLPGVTVQVKGSTKGTQTGPDGTYKLEVPQGATSLVFTFVGYKREELLITASGTANVSLSADVTALKDVVVVGYGTQKKSEVTSAVTSITAEDFRQSGARNALDLVQGKVAGLQISRLGGTNPNTGVAIQLRGVTSLTGSQQPLVVIDGIPNGNLDLLQQDDIESISVLKDGSAAAIYGTQANGGVILVTTKRGKKGPARVDYNTYFRKEYVQRRPDFLSADEFAAKIASGEIPNATDKGHRTDFVDLLVDHGNLSQYHNLAVSGGNESSSYRASMYYQNLEGILKENERRQYGGRISINSKGLNDRLTTQINLATNFNKANRLTDGGNLAGYYAFQPTYSPYNADGSWYFETTSTNELARLFQQTNMRQQQTSSGDAKLTLDLVKGLKASLFGSLQRDSWTDGAYADLASELSKETYQGTGYASQNNEMSNKYALEPTVEYNISINNKHNITAIGGYSYRYEVYQGFNANNYGFVNDRFEENNLNAGNQLKLGKAGMGSYKNDNTLVAFFGRVNYAFGTKYMVSAILRREGSSRFGANNKWGNFPAISAGWNLKEESFLHDASFIDQLKLRAGYGVTGNSGINNYSSLVTMGTGGNYINPDGVWRQTYGPNKNPNPDLKWEKKAELNVGIDYGFFRGRLTGSVDVFTRKTSDVLESFTAQLPPFVTDNVYANVGTLKSNGFELTINSTNVDMKDFRWTTDVAFSTATTKLAKFSSSLYKATYKEYGGIGGFGALGNAIRTYEGGKLGNFYGKRFAGFTEDGLWQFYKKDGTKASADQLNSATDFAVIGNAIPKYYLSVTNSFKYKNWDLRVFMRGRLGYDVLNTMEMFYGTKKQLPNNVLHSAFTKHAQLKDGYQYSDYYIEKGGYMKLDEVTIGYNVPFNGNKYIHNMRIYFTGGNLATITGYSGNDPDFIKDTGLNPGIDALNNSDNRTPYMSTRSFMFGLNVGF